MKVALIAPHIFMQEDILPNVIFSPGKLAIELADALYGSGVDITLFTPGSVKTKAQNTTADMSLFEAELKARGDSYLDLLKKHPVTFISLARQVQSELIAKAFAEANNGAFDIVHIYMNEEDIALPFTKLCNKPVVFTHHDPYTFLTKYRTVFPKYSELNWISMSYAQRKTMPKNTNWVSNIYHGLNQDEYKPIKNPSSDYVAYIGRIIQPKGLHLAIKAIQQINKKNPNKPLTLKIAGKHYSGNKDSYWKTHIEPQINNKTIQYCGYIKDAASKNTFIGNASALIVPSLFEEPFGMVVIEALASGTPVIGFNSGALPELVNNSNCGIVVQKIYDSNNTLNEEQTIKKLADALENMKQIERGTCRDYYESQFTLNTMRQNHIDTYKKLIR